MAPRVQDPWDESCARDVEVDVRKLQEARKNLSTVLRHWSQRSLATRQAWSEECEFNVKPDLELLKKVRSSVLEVARVWSERPTGKKGDKKK